MMIRVLVALSLSVAVTSAASAQTLSLQFADGRVVLDARNVSVRQILERWAQQGNVRVVNIETLPTVPITILLEGVSERSALDTLLRDTGYMVGQRQSSNTPTEFDRILIVPPGSGPVRTASVPTPPIVRSPNTLSRPLEPGVTDQPASGLLIIGATPEPVQQGTRSSSGTGATMIQGGAPGTINPPIASPDTPPAPRYQEAQDSQGNPIKGPTIPPPPPDETPATGSQSVPGNPFGVTTGSDRPGTVSPGTKR